MSRGHRFDELQPPWVAFPDLTPDELSRHLKQGLIEAWVDAHWRPFWASLDREEREGYFEYWDASEEWRETIRFFFEPDPDYDPIADQLESEEYLRVMREKRQREKRSLLSRIFGRR